MALNDVIKTMLGEAAGESDEGLRLVASIILNRSAIRGITPEEVVRQKHQFDGYSKPGAGAKKSFNDPKQVARAQRIYDEIAANGVPEKYAHADHFKTPDVHPGWANTYKKLGTEGGHEYYTSGTKKGYKVATGGSALAAIDAMAPNPQDRPTGLGYAQQPGDMSALPIPTASGAPYPLPRSMGDAARGETGPLPRYQGDVARGTFGAADSLALNPALGGASIDVPYFDAGIGTMADRVGTSADGAISSRYAMGQFPSAMPTMGMIRDQDAPGMGPNTGVDPFAMPPQRLPELGPTDFAKYFSDPVGPGSGGVANLEDWNQLQKLPIPTAIDAHPSNLPYNFNSLSVADQQKYTRAKQAEALAALRSNSMDPIGPGTNMSTVEDFNLASKERSGDPAYSAAGNPFAPTGVAQGKDLTRLSPIALPSSTPQNGGAYDIAAGNPLSTGTGIGIPQTETASGAPYPMPYEMGDAVRAKAFPGNYQGTGGVDIEEQPVYKTPDPFGDDWKVSTSTDAYGKPVNLSTPSVLPPIVTPQWADTGKAAWQPESAAPTGLGGLLAQLFGGGKQSSPALGYSGSQAPSGGLASLFGGQSFPASNYTPSPTFNTAHFSPSTRYDTANMGFYRDTKTPAGTFSPGNGYVYQKKPDGSGYEKVGKL